MKTRPAPAFSCEICVLSGGLSSRLGREKARLRLGPRTLLGHVRQQARALGLPVRVIRRDRVPRCGPLGGVYTALVTSRAEAVLFLACDMPFLTAETMARLWRRSAAQRRSVFFVSESGTVGFPFLVRRAALSVVEGQAARKRFSLHQLAAALKAVTLAFPRARRQEALNVNTPADWEVARQLWRRRRRKAATAHAAVRWIQEK